MPRCVGMFFWSGLRETAWQLVGEAAVIAYEAALVGARQVSTASSLRLRARDREAVLMRPRGPGCGSRSARLRESARSVWCESNRRRCPSEYDFVAAPLAAAVFAFRDFENMLFDIVPDVRTYTIVDAFFGAVVFVGVLVDAEVVEIADFDDDPDNWVAVDDEPS